MDRFVRAALVCVSLIAILVNGSAISVGAEKVASKVLFSLHVISLCTKSPDQQLAMPVEGVSKSQIADTWHVPREGDRLA